MRTGSFIAHIAGFPLPLFVRMAHATGIFSYVRQPRLDKAAFCFRERLSSSLA